MESDVTESDFSDLDANTFAKRSLNSPHLIALGDAGTGNSRSRRKYEHNWDADPEPLPTTPTMHQKNRTSGAYDFQRGEDSDDRLGLTGNRHDEEEEEESDDSHYRISQRGDFSLHPDNTSSFTPVKRPVNFAASTPETHLGNSLQPNLTESSSSFDSNTDDTLTDSSSPVHQPVYGRYRKIHHDTTGDECDDNGDNPVDRLILHRLPGENLGMVLGVEASQEAPDSVDSVTVKSVTLGGAAFRATGGTRGICVGDEILEINGRDLRRLKYDECLAIFPEMPLRVELTVRRARAPPRVSELPSPPRGSGPGSRAGVRGRAVFYDSTASEQSEGEEGGQQMPEGFTLMQVHVEKPPQASLGLSIVPSYGSTRDYYQIKRLLPSGVCAQSGRLQVGDRLVACNGFKLRRITQTQCLSVLKNSGESVLLTVLRQKQNDIPLDFQYARTSGSSESELQDSGVKSQRDRKPAKLAAGARTSVNGVGASVPARNENRARTAAVEEEPATQQQGVVEEPCELFAQTGVPLAYSQTFPPTSQQQPVPGPLGTSQSMSESASSDLDLRLQSSDGELLDGGAVNGNGNISSDVESLDPFAPVSAPTVSAGKAALPDLMDSVIGRPDDTDDDLVNTEGEEGGQQTLDLHVPPPAEFSDAPPDVVVDSEITVEVGKGGSAAMPVTDIDDLLGLMSSSSLDNSPQHVSHTAPASSSANGKYNAAEDEEEEVLIATMETTPKPNLDLLVDLDMPPLPTSAPPPVPSNPPPAAGDVAESEGPPLPSCPPPPATVAPAENLLGDFEAVNARECLAVRSSEAMSAHGARGENHEAGPGGEGNETAFTATENVTSLTVTGADVTSRKEDDYVTKVNIAPPEIPERCPDIKDDAVTSQKRTINVGPQVTKVDVVTEPKHPPVPSPRSRKPKGQILDASKVITVTDDENRNSGPTVISVDADVNHNSRDVQPNGGATLVTAAEDFISPVSVKKDEAAQSLRRPLTTTAVPEQKTKSTGDNSDADDVITPTAVQRDSLGRLYVIETTSDAIKRDVKPREISESSRLAVAQSLIALSNSMSPSKEEGSSEHDSATEEDIVPVSVSREDAAKVLEVLNVWNPSKAKPEKTTKSPFRRMVGAVMKSEEKEDSRPHSDDKPVEEIMQAEVKGSVEFSAPPPPPPKSEPPPKHEPAAAAEEEEPVVLRRKPRKEPPPVKERNRSAATEPPHQEAAPAVTTAGEDGTAARVVARAAANSLERGGRVGAAADAGRPGEKEEKEGRSPAARHSVSGWAGTKGEATHPEEPAPPAPPSAQAPGQQEARLSASNKMSSLSAAARISGKAGGEAAPSSTTITAAATTSSSSIHPEVTLRSHTTTTSTSSSTSHPEVTLRSHTSSSAANRSLMAARRISAPVGPIKVPGLAPLKIPSKISSLKPTPLLMSSKQAKVEYPKSRCEDRPFQVDVLKGIVGLGMKVKVTGEGFVEVTEIQKNSALSKNGHVRVGDYILSINGTELTGHTDSKVQQILRLLPRGLVKIVASPLPPDQIKETAAADTDDMQPSHSPVTSPQPSGMVSPFGVRLSARPFSAIITSSDIATTSPITSPRRYSSSSSEASGAGDATRPAKADGEERVASPALEAGSGDAVATHDGSKREEKAEEVEPEIMTQEIVSKPEAAVRPAPRERAKEEEPEVVVAQKVILQEEVPASSGERQQHPMPSPRRKVDSHVTVSVGTVATDPTHVATSDGDFTVKVKGPSGKVPPPVPPKPKAKPAPTPTARGISSSSSSGTSLRDRMNVYENVAVQGKPVFDSSSIQKRSHGPAVTTISVTAATSSPPATAKFATEIRVSDSPTHTMARHKGSHIAEKSAVPMVSDSEGGSSRLGLTATAARLHSGSGRKVFGASAFSGKDDGVDHHQSPLSPTRRSVTSPTEASPAPKFDSPDARSTSEHGSSHSLSMPSSPPAPTTTTSPPKPGEAAANQPLEGAVIIEPALNRALAPRRKSHPAQSPMVEKPPPDPLAALRRKPKHSLPELSQSDVEAAAATVAEKPPEKSPEKVKAPPPVPPKPRNRRSLIEQAEAALQGDIVEAAVDTCIFDSASDIQPKFGDGDTSPKKTSPRDGVVEVKMVETVQEDNELSKSSEANHEEVQKRDISPVRAVRTEMVPAGSESSDNVDAGASVRGGADQSNASLLVLDDAIESEVEGSTSALADPPKSDLLLLDDTIDSEVESSNVVTPGMDVRVSSKTELETKEEKETVPEIVEEAVQVVQAAPAESVPEKREEKEEEKEAEKEAEPMEEDGGSRSPSPPPLPSSPPPLPTSPPPMPVSATRVGDFGSVTVEDLDHLLTKDDSGLDSLSGSNGHVSSMDLDTLETINSDDGHLEDISELPSGTGSATSPDRVGGEEAMICRAVPVVSSAPAPSAKENGSLFDASMEGEAQSKEDMNIEEAAGRVVKQVCEAAYLRYTTEKEELLSSPEEPSSPKASTSEDSHAGKQEFKAEASVATEASPQKETVVDAEDIIVPQKAEGHKKLEDAFAALTDFPVDDEDVKVTNRVFLPGDVTSSKAAVFGDAFAEVATSSPAPAPPSTTPQPEAKHDSPSPVPRTRRARPAILDPTPQVEVHEDFSQHVNTSVAAPAPSSVHAAQVVEDDVPPPLPTAKVPPLPSSQASDSRGSSAGARDEARSATVTPAQAGDAGVAKTQGTSGIYSAVKMNVTRSSTYDVSESKNDNAVIKDITSSSATSKDGVKGPEVTTSAAPGMASGEAGGHSVEIKSSRSWSLISNHSTQPLLEGAADSSRTITASDLSQVSLLSPEELARMIHTVNETMDRGRQRVQYTILIVLLYRDTPDQQVGIELLSGRSGIILVRSCRRGGLATRSRLVQGGDQVMLVNGESSEGRTASELLELLERPGQHLILGLVRGVDAVFLSDSKAPLSPTAVSPPETPSPAGEGEGEEFEVTIVKGVTGVGFSLEGGKESIRGDLPITIKRIFKGGPADKSGQLKVKDAILKVNDLDFTTMRHYEAWNHLKFLPDGEIRLLIRRAT